MLRRGLAVKAKTLARGVALRRGGEGRAAVVSIGAAVPGVAFGAAAAAIRSGAEEVEVAVEGDEDAAEEFALPGD